MWSAVNAVHTAIGNLQHTIRARGFGIRYMDENRTMGTVQAKIPSHDSTVNGTSNMRQNITFSTSSIGTYIGMQHTPQASAWLGNMGS